MTAAPRFVLLAVALVACKGRAPTVESPAPRWVGLRFHDTLTELPPPLEWSGESLVGPHDAGFGVTWATVAGTKTTVILLERLVEPDPPLWEVVAEVEIPRRAGTALQTLACSVRGAPDPWVIAVVPTSPACATAGATGHAFRFVADGPRLEPLPLADVSCDTPCDEPGGAMGSTPGGG